MEKNKATKTNLKIAEKSLQKKRHFLKKLTFKTAMYIIMLLIAVLMIFPFLWTILGSLKSVEDNLADGFILFPNGSISQWQYANYELAIGHLKFWKSFFNTIIITLPKLFGDVFISALVAYGFARYEFKGKNTIFLILLATLIIPFEVTMLPLYIAYAKIGWIDTYYPLVVPSLFGAAQFIFFLTMYFITMPKDLIAAAKIDGLNDFKIFTKIYLPISLPAIVVVGIWSFQGTWNDLLGPLIWLQSLEKFTLQLSLAQMSTTTTGVPIPQGVMLAATILIMLPVFIVFLLLQRYILDSTKTSGIKG